jgi:RNA polymerase sigma factor (sigma-70 family)
VGSPLPTHLRTFFAPAYSRIVCRFGKYRIAKVHGLSRMREKVDEAFLIDRAVVGDGAALAALLQEYEPRLLEYARKRLPRAVWSIAAPEDVVQDAAYEACRLIRGFVPQRENSFGWWLRKITNLRIKATIRKYKTRRIKAISQDLPSDPQDQGDLSVLSALSKLVLYRRTPSASGAAHEWVAVVETALAGLPRQYRDVIEARFLEELSVAQTATRMQCDAEKVYQLCSRALGALKVRLNSASHFI